MYWGMMFGDIVAVVFFSGCPVVSELALIFSVSEPMVLHIHCLELFHDIVVDNVKGGCVVRLHWGRVPCIPVCVVLGQPPDSLCRGLLFLLLQQMS